MVIEFESTHVGITAVFLLLVVVDIAGNTLVCLIIKRHLQTRCVQNVRIRKQVHLLLDFRNAGWEVAFLTVPSMYLFSLRIKTIVCTAFWTRFFILKNHHKLPSCEPGCVRYSVRNLYYTKGYRQPQSKAAKWSGRFSPLQTADWRESGLDSRNYLSFYFGGDLLWKILHRGLSAWSK